MSSISLSISSKESASNEEEGHTLGKHQKATVHRHALTYLDDGMKDLKKWHHDLCMKFIASRTRCKTNNHKIERLKDYKKKLKYVLNN